MSESPDQAGHPSQPAQPTQPTQPAEAEPTRMSVARVYDYILGGTHNYEIDRVGAERLRAVYPDVQDFAWANRGFHQRAAKWITRQGIDQFIDIGSGLPTQINTHEAVHSVDPNARVVYVDIEEAVAEHAHDLLRNTENAIFIMGDAREPEALLADKELRDFIDLDRPVGILMTAILHFITDDADPWGLIRRMMDRVPSGSYIGLSHGVVDKLPEGTKERLEEVYKNATEQAAPRREADVVRFFEGLELVPPYNGAKPGVSYGGVWGAEDPTAADSEGGRSLLVGVARKP